MKRKAENIIAGAFIVLILSMPFAFLSCSNSPSRTEVVKAYQAAVKSADIDSILSLFADDAVVEVFGMGRPLQGRNEIRSKAEYDSALHCDLSLTILESRKDTVFCQGLESNDWTRELELPPYDYSSFAFVIRAGKIVRLRAELSEQTVAGINNVMTRLIPWAQEKRPAILDSLMAHGGFAFSVDSARLMMALLGEWRGARSGG
jgi:hypothetical protein